MSGETRTIVLYEEDLRDLEELKYKLNIEKNVNVFRKLVRFYRANSPIYR